MDGKTIVYQWRRCDFIKGEFATDDKLIYAIDAAIAQANREGQESMRERVKEYLQGACLCFVPGKDELTQMREDHDALVVGVRALPVE